MDDNSPRASHVLRRTHGCIREEGIQAINDMTIGREQTEEVMLTSEVSDEALEECGISMGGEKAGNYTLFTALL